MNANEIVTNDLKEFLVASLDLDSMKIFFLFFLFFGWGIFLKSIYSMEIISSMGIFVALLI